VGRAAQSRSGKGMLNQSRKRGKRKTNLRRRRPGPARGLKGRANKETPDRRGGIGHDGREVAVCSIGRIVDAWDKNAG